MSSSTDYAAQPYNAGQPVTWWLANYYPTNAPGEAAEVIGTIFETQAEAETWARAKLATEGVGMVLVTENRGITYFPLYEPEPN